MPRVPTYDNLQTQVSGMPNAQFGAPSGPTAGGIAAEQASQFGKNLTAAGGEMAKIQIKVQEEANQVLIDDATNQLVQKRTQLQIEALSMTGRNALDRPDGQSLQSEYGDKLKAVTAEISSKLRNSAQQKSFAHASGQLANQMNGTLGTHVLQQQKQFQADTWKATALAAQQQGVMLYGDPAMREQSASAIDSVVGKISAANKWDPTEDKALIDGLRTELMSPMIGGIIHGMLGAGKSADALDYYNANSTMLTLPHRVALHDAIQSVDVMVRGEAGADAAWAAFAPKGPNDPIRLYDMEQSLRETFKGDPKMRDAAMTSIKQRAVAFNAQQSEVNAGGINTIYGMIDAGESMIKVKSSSAWLGLPEAKRHEITKGLESEAATRAARGASEASRQVSLLTANDKLSLISNGADYLHDSDPDVLGNKTRAEVEAMRTKYGFEGTQHLLSRYDMLQNKDAKLTARIDDSTFKAVVTDVLDIDAYRTGNSETKAMLGNLKNRVDILLQSKAQALRRPLTTEEKTQFMRDEAAKVVTINGWINSEKPAMALTPSQASRVVVPAAMRVRLLKDLADAYKKTGDKDYGPTEGNLRRLYLKEISPLSGLPDATQ